MAKSISITITQNSQNVTNNTSNVTVTCKITTSGESYRGTHRTGTCIINGTSYSFQSGAPANSTTTLFTKTLDITHNSDGTKTLSVSCNYDSGWCTASTSKMLSTIARESKFGTVSGVTMGGNMTINITRYSNSFTHSLWYHFGSKTWQAIASGAGTSASFTIPLSLASEVPNATYGDMTLVLRTYNGSTQIGKDQTVAYRVHVPDTVKPVVNSISVSEATGGIASQFGCYVKNKSKLSVSVSAGGSYGSTIKSYSTSVNGTNYSGSSFISGLLTSAGTVAIKSVVNDSRGRPSDHTTAASNTSVTVVDYANPSISSFTVARCLSDGTLSDDGTYVKYTYSYNISPVNNKNTKTVKVQYLNGSTWTDLASNTAYSASGASGVSTKTFSADSGHQFRLYVADYFTSVTSTASISTAFTLINFNASGKGLAVGKVSEGDNFDIDLPVLFRKGYERHQTTEPIASTSSDTVGNWGALKNTIAWYAKTGCLIDQPSQYGMLLNYVTSPNEVHQLWLTQASGDIRHRGGNNSGWSGTWKTILDSTNYSSYCAAASHSHSYLPLSGGTLTGSVTSSSNIKIQNTTNILGEYRLNSGWIGLYGSYNNALNNTSRKGWIGHDGTTQLTVKNEAGSMICLTGGDISIVMDLIGTSSGSNVLRMSSNASDKIHLGYSNTRWSSVYAKTGSVSTSDREKKKNIQQLDELYYNLAERIEIISYQFKETDQADNIGRTHIGSISQQVEEVMEELGMTGKDFAGFCKDVKLKTEYDENGHETFTPIEGEYDYSLRYDEIAMLKLWYLEETNKRQQKQINELEDKVTKLEGLVQQLLDKDKSA